MGRPIIGPRALKQPKPPPVEEPAPQPETEEEFWGKVIDLKDMTGELLMRGTRWECKQLVMSHSVGHRVI